MSRKTNRKPTLTPLELWAKEGRKRRAGENRLRRRTLGFVNRHDDRSSEPIHRKQVQARLRDDRMEDDRRKREFQRELKEDRSRAARGI
jgi:hypothetical protein